MRARTQIRTSCIITAVFLAGAIAIAAHAGGPAGTTITYQGLLADGGGNVDGQVNLEFRLFDAEVAGAQVGATSILLAHDVIDGLFTADLDFGVDPYTAVQPLWLEVKVNAEVLSRQQVTSAPFSLATRGLNVDGAGNVGIGTATPATPLHVLGDATVGSALTLDNTAQADRWKLFVASSNRLAFRDEDAGLTHMIINASGNVGIGTTSPVGKLHVMESSTGGTPISGGKFVLESNAGSSYINMLTPNNVSTGIVFGDPQNGADGGVLYQHSDNHMEFRTGGNVERMRITGSGNVGIGMSAPEIVLDVQPDDVIGTSYTVGNHNHPDNRGEKVSFGYVTPAEFNNPGVLGLTMLVEPGTNDCGNSGDIQFNTWECNTATPREVMRITGGGEVGIGRSTPRSALEVAGTATVTGPGVLSDCCFSHQMPGCDNDTCEATVCGGDAFCCNTSWDNLCVDDAVASCGICNLPGAKLGVGTSAPSTAFEVRDDAVAGWPVRITSNANAGFNLDTDGTASTSWGIFHDGPSDNLKIRDTFNGSDRIIVSGASGAVTIPGTLSKGGGSFRIDHPLDPENQELYHSFVESPDMMNVYNGNVHTDDRGYATITLPDYFEALNRDFRYQLTVIDDADSDEFVSAKVVQRIAENRFTVRSSAPRTEVSWQVTGIRHDPFANANRIPTVVDKRPEERGLYIHPEARGLSREMGADCCGPEQAQASAPNPAASGRVAQVSRTRGER